MRNEFTNSILANQELFGLELPEDVIERLADYYAIILEHNPILHLVGPCTPEEFATRHILESLTMAKYLPNGAKFADIGTGGGLPAIPCLLVREDLRAMLIESKEKKTKFLDMAIAKLGLEKRTRVVNKQFPEVDPIGCESVTCRALDKFTEKLPSIVRWKLRRQLLFFGGPNLRDALNAQKLTFVEKLMPLSEQRYLFVVNR